MLEDGAGEGQQSPWRKKFKRVSRLFDSDEKEEQVLNMFSGDIPEVRSNSRRSPRGGLIVEVSSEEVAGEAAETLLGGYEYDLEQLSD